MNKYMFIVTLLGGITFTQVGEGYNESEALMDACWQLSDSEYPQDEVVGIEVVKQEGVV